MYDQFYGFSERPFSLLPDPDFLYLGEQHRAALDTLELAILNRSGFCVISGGIGTGKTTVVRELLNRLSDGIHVGLVSNTHPSFGELMQWVMAAYGLSCDMNDRIELHKRFLDYTIQHYADGKHTLLIIDEAQNLSLAALEELRMLSNVNSEKDLVLQIILIGQSELREKLRKPELVQFAQRISVDYNLCSLTLEETALYIQHRVTHAGGAADLFTADACRCVFEFSQGIPRVINRLCDLSLVYGYAHQRDQIDADLVDAVVQEQRLGEAMESARQRAAAAPTPVAKPAVADVVPTETRDTQTDLHTLIVNAEQSSGTRSERSALWLFLGVAAMVSATAWISRDAWLPALQGVAVLKELGLPGAGAPVSVELPVAGDAKLAPEAVEQARLEVQREAEQAELEQAGRKEAQSAEQARLARQQVAEQAKLEQARRAEVEREEQARLAKQQAAEQLAAKQAELKQARREEVEREEQARLAKQLAVEQAKQEQARREKARREEQGRLAKRKAAEKARLAQVRREKAQREKARREEEARLVEQRAAEKAALEQAGRGRGAPGVVFEPGGGVSTSAPATWPNSQEWAEAEAKSEAAAATLTSDNDKSDSAPAPDGFSTNPCNGPTARFLSTCR